MKRIVKYLDGWRFTVERTDEEVYIQANDSTHLQMNKEQAIVLANTILEAVDGLDPAPNQLPLFQGHDALFPEMNKAAVPELRINLTKPGPSFPTEDEGYNHNDKSKFR